eukprot:g6651.t1
MLGDLGAQVEKLKGQLRLLRFPLRDFMEQGVVTGKPIALLPILHFVFFSFSKPFSTFIREMGYELYAKSDLRFVEECYKILRKELHYRPTISSHQFFQNGFVERKVMLLQDVIRVVRRWHNDRVGSNGAGAGGAGLTASTRGAVDALGGSTLLGATAASVTTPRPQSLSASASRSGSTRKPLGNGDDRDASNTSRGKTPVFVEREQPSLAEMVLQRRTSGVGVAREDLLLAGSAGHEGQVVPSVSAADEPQQIVVHNSMELDFTMPPPQPHALQPSGGSNPWSGCHSELPEVNVSADDNNRMEMEVQPQTASSSVPPRRSTAGSTRISTSAATTFEPRSRTERVAQQQQGSAGGVPVIVTSHSGLYSATATAGSALEKRMNEMADLLQNLAARVTILEMERKLDQSRDQRTRSATSPSATAASSSRPPASRALFSYGNQHVHGSTLYNKGEIPMSKSTVDETPLDDKFLADARYDYSEFSGAGAAAAAPPSKLSGVMNTTTSSASPVEVVGGVAIPSAEETQKLIASLTAKFRDTQTLLDKARGQGLAR